MKHENTIGYEVKTLENLMCRNLVAFSTARGMDELTIMHGWIIGYLYENREREIYQKDLEKEFYIARSTVTNIIKLMEKKGYIQRASVERDARLKRLILTEKGYQLHEDKEQIIVEMERWLREDLEPEEAEQFMRTARKLKRRLSDSLKKNGWENIGFGEFHDGNEKTGRRMRTCDTENTECSD